jgi:hypothetical protein
MEEDGELAEEGNQAVHYQMKDRGPGANIDKAKSLKPSELKS